MIELTNSYTSSANYYTVNFPFSWKYEVDDVCVSFFNPDEEMGAVQISSYSVKHHISAIDNLKEHFLKNKDLNEETKNVILQGIKGDERKARLDTKIASRFWIHCIISQRENFLRKGSKVLYVTYNCNEGRINSNVLEIIESIIGSIRFN